MLSASSMSIVIVTAAGPGDWVSVAANAVEAGASRAASVRERMRTSWGWGSARILQKACRVWEFHSCFTHHRKTLSPDGGRVDQGLLLRARGRVRQPQAHLVGDEQRRAAVRARRVERRDRDPRVG